MKAEGIHAVLGMPYSGSTLLSFIMGSSDQVYNGADLHHLNNERKGICSIHKDKCPVFSSEFAFLPNIIFHGACGEKAWNKISMERTRCGLSCLTNGSLYSTALAFQLCIC